MSAGGSYSPRILRVPLVFRMDQESDNNNKRCMQLLGHPALLALPSRLSPATLTQTLAPRIPPGTSYSLLFVDGRVCGCVVYTDAQKGFSSMICYKGLASEINMKNGSDTIKYKTGRLSLGL